MRNQDIRDNARAAGVRLWQIAGELKLHDSNFSRLLRRELPPDKKEEILGIVNNLKAKKEETA